MNHPADRYPFSDPSTVLCASRRNWPRVRIEDRIAELNRQIAAVRQWGGALTAMDEERRSLQRELDWLNNGPEG
jgi:hypothetical protein